VEEAIKADGLSRVEFTDVVGFEGVASYLISPKRKYIWLTRARNVSDDRKVQGYLRALKAGQVTAV
jgi:hypothetical protein